MFKVGITGGIGSGKSTVCKVFELLGIPVFYADDAAREVMHLDKELKAGLIENFGAESYTLEGKLNRKHIADLVFKDDGQLAKLNLLVHPAVFRAFDIWAAEHTDAPYLIKEAALLFESDAYKMCSESVLVRSDEETRIARVMKRDGSSREEVISRMRKQLSDEYKAKQANHVIWNTETQLLIPQVLELHNYFLSKHD